MTGFRHHYFRALKGGIGRRPDRREGRAKRKRLGAGLVVLAGVVLLGFGAHAQTEGEAPPPDFPQPQYDDPSSPSDRIDRSRDENIEAMRADALPKDFEYISVPPHDLPGNAFTTIGYAIRTSLPFSVGDQCSRIATQRADELIQRHVLSPIMTRGRRGGPPGSDGSVTWRMYPDLEDFSVLDSVKIVSMLEKPQIAVLPPEEGDPCQTTGMIVWDRPNETYRFVVTGDCGCRNIGGVRLSRFIVEGGGNIVPNRIVGRPRDDHRGQARIHYRTANFTLEYNNNTARVQAQCCDRQTPSNVLWPQPQVDPDREPPPPPPLDRWAEAGSWIGLLDPRERDDSVRYAYRTGDECVAHEGEWEFYPEAPGAVGDSGLPIAFDNGAGLVLMALAGELVGLRVEEEEWADELAGTAPGDRAETGAGPDGLPQPPAGLPADSEQPATVAEDEPDVSAEADPAPGEELDTAGRDGDATPEEEPYDLAGEDPAYDEPDLGPRERDPGNGPPVDLSRLPDLVDLVPGNGDEPSADDPDIARESGPTPEEPDLTARDDDPAYDEPDTARETDPAPDEGEDDATREDDPAGEDESDIATGEEVPVLVKARREVLVAVVDGSSGTPLPGETITFKELFPEPGLPVVGVAPEEEPARHRAEDFEDDVRGGSGIGLVKTQIDVASDEGLPTTTLDLEGSGPDEAPVEAVVLVPASEPAVPLVVGVDAADAVPVDGREGRGLHLPGGAEPRFAFGPVPEPSAGHAGAGLSLVPASYEPGVLAQAMPSADIGTLFARYGRDSFAIGDTQIYALSVPPQQAAAVREALQAQPAVTFVEDDDCYKMQRLEPDDPYFHDSGLWDQEYDDQWAIKRVGYTAEPESAWTVLEGAEPREVVVAVIDSGIDWYHPDLTSMALWHNPAEIADTGRDDDGNGYIDDVIGWDFIRRGNSPWDHAGHGTFVAGIIAATSDNALGIAGINPYARIMTLRTLDAFGQGYASATARAIVYAVDNDAEVINLSLGGTGPSSVVQLAVDYARSHGVAVVVAAGNEGIDLANYAPAGLDGVVTVAATDLDDRRAGFSNWGPQVDIAAPGIDVLSLRARGTDLLAFIPEVEYELGMGIVGADRAYYRASGTSFAAPIVAGTVSLILSARPELTAEQAVRMVLHSARDIETPGFDNYTGYGLLDAAAAVRADPDYFVEARITGVEAVRVEGATRVRLHGTANADAFAEARISLGAGSDPDDWTELPVVIEQPVDDGPLADIAAQMFQGAMEWTLRLVIRHEDGSEREARFVLRLG